MPPRFKLLSTTRIVVNIAVLVLTAVAFATPAAASASSTPRDLSTVVADQARGNTDAACHPNVYIYSRDNNRYVSAEIFYDGDDYGMLRARADAVGPWERFTVCFQDWYWTIQSQANDLFVSAELGYSDEDHAMLRARAGVIGPWERFTINVNGCGSGCTTIVSQANDRIVSAEMFYDDEDYGMLRARATAVGPWERFFVSL